MRIPALTSLIAVYALCLACGEKSPKAPDPKQSRDDVSDVLKLWREAEGRAQRDRAEIPPPLEAPPTASQVHEQLRRLDKPADKDARLETLRWFHDHAHLTSAGRAVAALERLARDPDSTIRGEAVLALALVSFHQKSACPLPIVEALLDNEEDVRWQAIHCIGLFKRFPPGAVDLLLRSVDSVQREVRSESLWALAVTGGKQTKVLVAIEKAMGDREFLVRHNAHLAAFRATDKLEDYLRYLIRLDLEPEALLRPVPIDPKARDRDQAVRNLAVISRSQEIQWSEERAAELASLLLKLLDDKSPVMRRGAARRIEFLAVKMEDANGFGTWVEFLMPFLEEDAAKRAEVKPAPPRPSKLALELRKLKAAERLRRLSDDDPNELVRGAAFGALRRLESVAK